MPRALYGGPEGQHTTTFCKKEQQYSEKTPQQHFREKKNYQQFFGKHHNISENRHNDIRKTKTSQNTPAAKCIFTCSEMLVSSKTVAVISEMPFFDTQGRCIYEGPICKNWPPVEFILKTKEAGAF